MSILCRIFRRKTKQDTPVATSWEEIVERLYDKQLDSFCDEVTGVLYSRDRSMRYVILKDEKGHFTYQLEAIHQFDEKDDEWKFICSDDGTLHAMWEVPEGRLASSFFDNTKELLNEIKSESEYKQYFQ